MKKPSSKEFSKATPKANANKASIAKQTSVPVVSEEKLVDKWPNLKSAADWNREEKEREIRENLAKMAGITVGASYPIVGSKGSSTTKVTKAKLNNQ